MHSMLYPLFNHLDHFICITDEHCTIISTNNILNQKLGYAEGALIDNNITDLMHPADRHRFMDLFKQIMTGNVGKGTIETQLKARDGRYTTVNWIVVFDYNKKLFYTLGDYKPLLDTVSDPPDIGKSVLEVLQGFNEGFVMIDKDWCIKAFNPAFQAMSGLSAAKLNNKDIRKLKELNISEEVKSAFNQGFAHEVHVQIQYFEETRGRWFRVNVYPKHGELLVFFRDITNIRIPQLVLALEKKVLEMNAMRPDDLRHTVNIFLDGIETIFPDMICTILEVDDKQETVHVLAAPSLPEEFKKGLDGLAIGADVGTCGSAIYHRKMVIDIDIATSPSWEKYRQLALPYGLKSCWSVPVISSNSNKVLASFGIYYEQSREPKQDEVQIIERTANIIRVLIESKRNIGRLNEQNQRLQEIASISSHQLRRPVATILGLVNLFDADNPNSTMNKEIISHLKTTAGELDDVIHNIVKKTLEIG